MKAYKIQFGNGNALGPFSTYKQALEACEQQWPNFSFGHDGDLACGGDRTLVWQNEADAVNDDGARAVACIRRVSGD